MTFLCFQPLNKVMKCLEVILECIGVLDVFWAFPAQHGPIEFTHSNRHFSTEREVRRGALV